ncbi:MAG: Chemotaxis protein CheA [Syntrophorhabdus sp. PtaU1.Bin058]|nr:MAG: Chemotaxis protein CheA [Syntrophorhabdus sp. PtaU1.Bin058]
MSDEILKNDEMQEIIDEFVTESSELIENVIQDVVIIEHNPDEEIVNGIFRAVHTIKGTSSFLGFNALSQLAHKAEDVMGVIRKGEMKPDQEIADVLLEAFDLIKLMIEDIRAKSPEERGTNAAIERLEDLLKEDRKKIGEILVEEKVITRDERDEVLEKQKQEKEKKFGEIVVEEKLITETQLNNFLSKQKAVKEEQTIRIDVKKLDELMNLVGELVLGKNRLILLDSLVKKGSEGDGILDNLGDVTGYIEGITNGLQLSVMRARLVPIGKLFNKVPRQVRDLCGEFNKDIELKIEGENTELDRSLIEALHDPLIHIIRNSVDHGIEAPEERMKKGKRTKGMLSIKAYNEGNHVIIEVFDDGKGIDIQAVKEKVKEKGIMGDTELNNLSEKEAMNLIFIPGLSTAKKISKVSGRGVGMDVVKTNIEKMNGQAYIDSEEGKWSRLTIRLPLTLAIMRALIVKITDGLFAVPLNTVVELVKIREGLIKSVDKNEVFVLRDIVIPIVDLSKTFSEDGSNGKGGYLVICNIADKIIGIKVHAVVGQEEVVIKPLGEFLKNIKGISGATIRGDGKVIPILDIPGVISSFNIQRRMTSQQLTAAGVAAS